MYCYRTSEAKRGVRLGCQIWCSWFFKFFHNLIFSIIYYCYSFIPVKRKIAFIALRVLSTNLYCDKNPSVILCCRNDGQTIKQFDLNMQKWIVVNTHGGNNTQAFLTNNDDESLRPTITAVIANPIAPWIMQIDSDKAVHDSDILWAGRNEGGQNKWLQEGRNMCIWLLNWHFPITST